MNNKIFSNFNLYDQLGYILVGFYQFVLFCGFYTSIQKKSIIEFIQLMSFENIFGVLLLSYFVGHIIQAIANVLIKEKKDEKNDSFSYIFEKAKKYFNLEDNVSPRYVFQYCYLYALSNDFSGHVKLFNGMYSLYRGLFCVSIINMSFHTITLMIQLIFKYSITSLSIIGTLTIIMLLFFFSWLFYNRKGRFYKYMSEKTLITFDILMKDKKPKP